MIGTQVQDGYISCVVPRSSRFEFELTHWVASLTQIAGVDANKLIVCVVGDSVAEHFDRLRSDGVRVIEVESFDSRSPHCNKISGALAVAELGLAGPVVLTDTDMVFSSDPRVLSQAGSVAGKIVDVANPSFEILERVHNEASLPIIEVVAPSFHPHDRTAGTNLNGGLYAVHSEDLMALATAWEMWGRWILERPELLDFEPFHSDQVAMSLALTDIGIDVVHVPVEWNFPTQHRLNPEATYETPHVLHYHRNLNHLGLLGLTGLPVIDAAIGHVNGQLSLSWQEHFPNAQFWSWRYAVNPELGSGVGSRGEALSAKRRMLEQLDEILQPESVIDVGSGDLESTTGLFVGRYTGIDISAEAIARARDARPDADWVHGSVADRTQDADLVLCLDVLIHQSERAGYDALIDEIVSASTRALVVSGYEVDPQFDSPMVHFHEPLSQSLRKRAKDAELYVLGVNDRATTWLMLLPPEDLHPRDLQPSTLDLVAAKHNKPIELLRMRALSSELLRFFPNHTPRLWEYPNVAEEIKGRAAPGGRVLDIGAGVSPIVPYLERAGFRVLALDPSENHRNYPIEDDCNEWGYLDYAKAGLATESANCEVADLDENELFAAAYSVSVVEHIPADDRRRLFADVAKRIEPGGWLVLTVDIVRETDELWNRSSGEVVDPDGFHGSFSDFIEEIRAVGLTPVETEIIRDWGDEPVDIGWLVAQRQR